MEGGGELLDPVCGMTVTDHDLSGIGPDGATYYFCSEGCREAFLHGASPANHHHE
jgi:YHS domain-containing protein